MKKLIVLLLFPFACKEVKIDLAVMDNYTGKYIATGPIKLIKKDGKLYRHRDGAPAIELKPNQLHRSFMQIIQTDL